MISHGKLNVVAHNSFQLDTFCLNNELMRADIRYIRSSDDLFGTWRGLLIILDGVESRGGHGMILLEAARRELVIRRMGPEDKL